MECRARSKVLCRTPIAVAAIGRRTRRQDAGETSHGAASHHLGSSGQLWRVARIYCDQTEAFRMATMVALQFAVGQDPRCERAEVVSWRSILQYQFYHQELPHTRDHSPLRAKWCLLQRSIAGPRSNGWRPLP